MSNLASESNFRRRAAIPKEECPMALAAEILGDRWTLLILREAFYGVQRYDDMREDLGVPRSMLTDRLSKMVTQGLMARQPYQEPGARVRNAYVLTDMGKSLALTLTALYQWGEAHALEEASPIEMRDKTSGKPVHVAVLNEDGDVVDMKNVEMCLKKRKNKSK
tara:strand:+ start:5616 stop:6107 length:492 start_codon:yes stop_codon:yes gene_type:complete